MIPLVVICALLVLAAALLDAQARSWRRRLNVLREELDALKQERAEIVAQALGNSMIVDGVELPKPDDTRWERDPRDKYADGRAAQLLRFGKNEGVVIDHFDGIYAGSLLPMPASTGTKNYCAAVWKAYRSRVARKAIETA